MESGGRFHGQGFTRKKMIRVEKTVMVLHPASILWDLVADIRAYPEYLPWCSAADIISVSEDKTIATLHVNFHGLKQSFTTSNTGHSPKFIQMDLVEGPFSHLKGHFSFIPLSEDACKIEFFLEWDFSNVLLEKLVGPVFKIIASSMVNAFVKRADQLESMK